MRNWILLALFLSTSCVPVPAPADRSVPPAISAVEVPLNAAEPGRDIIGRLRFLGGVEFDSDDKRIGGFSSLKWRDGRLYSVTDIGDWAVFEPVERNGQLQDLRLDAMGDLLGPARELLEGTATGDAESITPDGPGWLVSFEHQHKVLRYRRFGEAASPSGLDPETLFGALDANQGVETIASRNGRVFLCAERSAGPGASHCILRDRQGSEGVSVPTPGGLDPKTAYPVDADWGGDGTLYILMRSWSGGNDNRGAVLARSPRGEFRTLATFVRPVTVDNYEGLAVREEGRRTFLYLVSDDNFRVYDDPKKPETWQRSLLMKFELLG